MTTKTQKPISDFERADIRLMAWKAIEGWGHMKPDGGINPWGWNERLAEAEKLAAWAMTK